MRNQIMRTRRKDSNCSLWIPTLESEQKLRKYYQNQQMTQTIHWFVPVSTAEDSVLTYTELAKVEERTCFLLDSFVLCNSSCTQDNIRADQRCYFDTIQCFLRCGHGTHRCPLHYRSILWTWKFNTERGDRKKNVICPLWCSGIGGWYVEHAY